MGLQDFLTSPSLSSLMYVSNLPKPISDCGKEVRIKHRWSYRASNKVKVIGSFQQAKSVHSETVIVSLPLLWWISLCLSVEWCCKEAAPGFLALFFRRIDRNLTGTVDALDQRFSNSEKPTTPCARLLQFALKKITLLTRRHDIHISGSSMTYEFSRISVFLMSFINEHPKICLQIIEKGGLLKWKRNEKNLPENHFVFTFSCSKNFQSKTVIIVCTAMRTVLTGNDNS